LCQSYPTYRSHLAYDSRRNVLAVTPVTRSWYPDMPAERDSLLEPSLYSEFGRPPSVARWGDCVQRYFSTFPEGFPGVGLLILRVLVGLTAATQGASSLIHGSDVGLVTVALAVAAVGGGAAVLLGFLTPGASVLAGAATLLLALGAPSSSVLAIDAVTSACVAADATALALLGPGAHSLDARLFGRREVVIPDRADARS